MDGGGWGGIGTVFEVSQAEYRAYGARADWVGRVPSPSGPSADWAAGQNNHGDSDSASRNDESRREGSDLNFAGNGRILGLASLFRR